MNPECTCACGVGLVWDDDDRAKCPVCGAEYIQNEGLCLSESWALAEIERLDGELAWCKANNQAIRDRILNTVHGIRFLRVRRKVAFQMTGQYTSEDCKQWFREEYELIDGLLADFNNEYPQDPEEDM